MSPISVSIPRPLRPECGGASELSILAGSVRAALEQLEQKFPALYRSVCNDTGAIRQHVNLFVNDLYLSQREGLDTMLQPGDILTIMPAVSGG